MYEVPCDDCELTFVGETLHTIKDRLKEHKRCVGRGDTKASAIAEHVWIEDHRMDFQKAKVIDRAKRMTQRRVKEALHIERHKGATMNSDSGLRLSEQWKVFAAKK